MILLKRILLLFFFTGLVIPLNASLLPDSYGFKELQNSYFTIRFDKKSGLISINRANGLTLISGAISAVNIDSDTYTADISNYSYSFGEESLNNEKGKGRVLRISGKDRMKNLNVEILVSLYDNVPGIVFETIVYCINGIQPGI